MQAIGLNLSFFVPCKVEPFILWQLIPACILIYFYLSHFPALLRRLKSKDIGEREINLPASLVIVAKNELINLQKNLFLWLDQTYSNFEVLIVDDGSIDGSRAFLESINRPGLKLLFLERSVGKKKALQKGIEKAKYPYIILTDADCIPASPFWLKKMMQHFHGNKQLVLGHGRFYSQTGFLNHLIRYECLSNAIQYFSFAAKGNPYMGVGRNLGYSRELFAQSRSFDLYQSTLSGDDDLFVNEMGNKENVALCLDPKAHTLSKASKTFGEYISQKRRQLQAGRHYQAKDRFVLAILGLSHLVFNISSLILLFVSSCKPLILIIFASKFLVQTIYYKKMSNFLTDKDVATISGFMDLIYYPLVTVIGLSTYIWKVKKWK